MKLTLRQQLTQFAGILQSRLFPALEEELGELVDSAKRLVATLELIPLGRFLPSSRGWVGRPSKDRHAIANAFIAKAVYGFSTTRQLLEALERDPQLRRLCGWESARQLPHESTFSRAFEEFACMQLPLFVHEVLIRETQKDRLIGHIARDSTAIEARERYPETPAQAAARQASRQTTPAPRKKGAPKGPHKRYRGGKRPYVPKGDTRLAQQRNMTLSQMLDDLPCQCDLGGKKDSHGNDHYWRGYKLHWDVADGQIPISAVLTSASVHDSQVAIPLATMSTQRVSYCYELMDSAYDAYHIREESQHLGHVPIIDPKAPGGPKNHHSIPLGTPKRELSWAQAERYRERTMVERVNARLKDEFGGRQVRVRGAAKVMAHLMFGVLALTADQLLKLIR